MVEKYYTPELHEFHFGFEFEYLHPLSVAKTTNEWQAYDWRSQMATVTLHPSGISIGGFSIKQECLRVKCLDKEDTEECGWDIAGEGYNGHSSTQPTTFKYTKPTVYRGLKTQVTLIHNIVTKWCCVSVNSNMEDKTLFAGYIKNKSELKKIMKMINIF